MSKIRLLSTWMGLCLTALLFSQSSHAKEFLVINSLALHFENFSERNTLTPGIGYEYSPDAGWGWHAGVFRDSFSQSSGYVGANYGFKPVYPMGVPTRLIMGVSAIHKQFFAGKGMQTLLLPVPILEFGVSRRTKLNISGAPAIKSGKYHNNGLLFVQLKFDMK